MKKRVAVIKELNTINNHPDIQRGLLDYILEYLPQGRLVDRTTQRQFIQSKQLLRYRYRCDIWLDVFGDFRRNYFDLQYNDTQRQTQSERTALLTGLVTRSVNLWKLVLHEFKSPVITVNDFKEHESIRFPFDPTLGPFNRRIFISHFRTLDFEYLPWLCKAFIAVQKNHVKTIVSLIEILRSGRFSLKRLEILIYAIIQHFSKAADR